MVVAGIGAVAAGFGAAVVAAAAGAVAAAGEAAVASVPHCALRKSFHFMPPIVPAVCASLYLAPHSFIVSAEAGPAAAKASAASEAAVKIVLRIVTSLVTSPSPHGSQPAEAFPASRSA